MEVHVDVLACLMSGWQIWQTLMALGREVHTVAVHHAHCQIRMMDLDMQTMSLLHRLKQKVEKNYLVVNSHLGGVGTKTKKSHVVASGCVGWRRPPSLESCFPVIWPLPKSPVTSCNLRLDSPLVCLVKTYIPEQM